MITLFLSLTLGAEVPTVQSFQDAGMSYPMALRSESICSWLTNRSELDETLEYLNLNTDDRYADCMNGIAEGWWNSRAGSKTDQVAHIIDGACSKEGSFCHILAISRFQSASPKVLGLDSGAVAFLEEAIRGGATSAPSPETVKAMEEMSFPKWIAVKFLHGIFALIEIGAGGTNPGGSNAAAIISRRAKFVEVVGPPAPAQPKKPVPEAQ